MLNFKIGKAILLHLDIYLILNIIIIFIQTPQGRRYLYILRAITSKVLGDKEGRIHYYGELFDLKNTFEDLFACSSAGTRNITRRINSNGYILSLINDYKIEVIKRKARELYKIIKGE